MSQIAFSRRAFLGQSVAMLATSTLRAEAAAAPTLLWKYDLASPSYGGGAIGQLGDDLAIVFGTYFNDEHLYALRAKDGKLLWKFKSEGGPFDASVAIADIDGDGQLEVLAADSSTGTLFCLDGAGKEKWKHTLPISTDSPPSIADIDGDGKLEIVVGVMSMGDKHGRVVALDAATRKEKWVAKVPGHVQSEPTLFDLGQGTLGVLVTTWRGDKAVRALNGKNGNEIWSYTMKGDMYHGVTAIKHEGIKIIANSIAGDVALLDEKGKLIWTKQPGGYLFAPTCAGDIDGDGQPEIIVCGGKVHAYDLNGEEKWASADYGSVPRGTAIAGLDGQPALFFGAKDRQFRALAGKSGKELLAYDATIQGHVYEGIDSGPIVADFDGDGILEAFFVGGKGTSDKTRPQNFGRAFAIKLGKGKDKWPMFRGNLRRTGTA
jgi:outer membrane protein assembly factor BamB